MNSLTQKVGSIGGSVTWSPLPVLTQIVIHDRTHRPIAAMQLDDAVGSFSRHVFQRQLVRARYVGTDDDVIKLKQGVVGQGWFLLENVEARSE